MAELKLIKDMDKLEETFREQVKDIFSDEDRIAVKLHMGEKDNPYYLKPDVIKKLIDVLNELGLKPFLFDSPVIYKGARDSVEKYYQTAADHGFTQEKIGCPIVISNNALEVKTKDLVIHACKELVEADGILVISHVKGHICYGFGAAIKNLGMGGVAKNSKTEIHKAENAVSDDLLAQGAQTVLSKYEKMFFVNFLTNIAKECDCFNKPGPLIADDIGVLFGKDIVAIDKASVDLINKQKPNIFKKIHNHDPYLQIEYAEKLGLGETKYVIS